MTLALKPAALLLALPLLLVGCAGGSGDAASTGSGGTVAAQGPAAAQTATVVGNGMLRFSPATVTMHPGTLRLTFQVSDGVPHDLRFDDPAVGAPFGVQSTGAKTQTFTFAKPGTYRFTCTIHPGMAGAVVVS